MSRAVALIAVLSLALFAGASSARPDAAQVKLGVLGGAARFQQLTGQRSTIRHVIAGWDQLGSAPSILGALTPTPMLGIGTGPSNTRGTISPLQIANGQGDAGLLALNAALGAFGAPAYVRPLPEMNNYHRPFSAFEQNGRPRGPSHSTAAFRKAFARIYLLLHGGPASRINSRLRRLGLPPLAQGGDLPAPDVQIVWNPQGYGSPDIPANSAQAYYPGDSYVDVVANDLYDQRFNAAWDANEALYKAHPKKRFGIAEWGLWDVDDPAFVERMATFVKTHPRTDFLVYYSGRPGSPWDLATKPKSRAAYRRLITPLG
ncbi:MAG: glycosyl hydrolase [Gaiella sp.]